MTNGHDPNTATLDEKIDQVMIPDTTDLPKYTVAGHTLTLRPLPLKQSKILNARFKQLGQMFTQLGDNFFDIGETVEDTYVGAAADLLSFYGIQGAGKEWIEEHLVAGEARRLIEAQMRVEDEHAFLRKNVQLLFGTIDAFLERAEVVAKTVATSFQPLLATSPSLNPGDSTPTDSSSGIQRDNSQ